jgi:hypothetical protein
MMHFTKIVAKVFLVSLSYILIPSLAQSATIKGKILDVKSSEALIGAAIYNKDHKEVHDVAGLDGSFSLKNVPPGTYTIVAEFFGYVTLEKTITISDDKQVIVQDFLMEPQSVNLGQVQVVSSYEKGSDNSARNAEKNADYVMNAISAKTIQLLVDVTVGDVLQRLSGVVTEKSVTGGGQYATIRGMDKRYNYTTVNGVKIPSPDFKNRYVPLDIIPSGILERLEVIKTLTPDMEGDAIGGAMNLVLKDAPDEFSIEAELASGYNAMLLNNKFQKFDASVINPNTPNEINGSAYLAKISDFPLGSMNYTAVNALPNLSAGATVGNRFLNKKFGVLFSVNYQNSYSGTQETFIKPQSEPQPVPVYNTPIWDYISSRYYSTQQEREAAHLKLDYEFNQRHKLTFYTLFAGMNQYRSNFEVDTNSSLKNSELDPTYETKVTFQQIFSAILQGQDTLAHNLYLDWTGAYSKATSNTPDWSKYSLLGTLGTPGDAFSSLSMKWMQLSDQDFTGYVNLTYQFKIFKQRVTLKAGIMNRDKDRSAFYAEYNVTATPNQPNFTSIAALLADTNLYRFSDVTGSPNNANSYAVHEDITGYYAMAKLNLFTRFDLLGGMRIENTSEAYVTQLPPNIPGQFGSSQYTNYLPSWGIKYAITDKMAVRLNYSASISRPSFFEIVPYSVSGDQYTEKGNPYLLPSIANNYDIRWEYFPNPSEQILAGVFVKQIYDPIELSVLASSSAPSATFIQPVNIGGDTGAPVINYGFEFVITKNIKNFSITANYTYTHSSITVPSQKYEGSPGNFKTVDTTETRPMQGQADHIANLSVIYSAPKIGLKVSLSAVYTGKLIADISAWYGLDFWQMPMTTIDFSFQKRLSKKYKITLYGKVSNLLNTPFILRMFPPNPYLNQPNTTAWVPGQDGNGYINSIVVQKDVYGQSFLLGLRYKF